MRRTITGYCGKYHPFRPLGRGNSIIAKHYKVLSWYQQMNMVMSMFGVARVDPCLCEQGYLCAACARILTDSLEPVTIYY